MALLETQSDYTFASNVEELLLATSKLNKAMDEQMELSDHLSVAIRQLTEAICEQNELLTKLVASKNCDRP